MAYTEKDSEYQARYYRGKGQVTKAAWRKRNPEKLRRQQKRYRATHSEHLSEYQKKWDAEHQEKIRARKREYYAKNAERIKAVNGAYYHAHAEAAKARTRKRQLARLGLTPEAYELLVSQQSGLCGICGRMPAIRLRVDHEHSSGRIRGLLCNACNTGIGLLREDPEILLAAIAWIRSAGKPHIVLKQESAKG